MSVKRKRRTYYQGEGRYTMFGPTKIGLLRRVDKVERGGGVSLTRPSVRKRRI
jgi:hypothetical protein